MEHADYVDHARPEADADLRRHAGLLRHPGAWTTFREAKLVYGLLGHGERVDLFEYDDTHGFSKPRREAAMPLDAPLAAGQGRRPGRGRLPDRQGRRAAMHAHRPGARRLQGQVGLRPERGARRELARARAAVRAVRPSTAGAARRGPPPDRPAEPIAAGRREEPARSDTRRLPVASWSSRPSRGSWCPPCSSRPTAAQRTSRLVVVGRGTAGDAIDAQAGPSSGWSKAGQAVAGWSTCAGWARRRRQSRRQAPGHFGADAKEAFLALAPRPPAARSAGRRPARSARRARRRDAETASPHRRRDRRPDRPARGGPRAGSSELTLERLGGLLVGRRRARRSRATSSPTSSPASSRPTTCPTWRRRSPRGR